LYHPTVISGAAILRRSRLAEKGMSVVKLATWNERQGLGPPRPISRRTRGPCKLRTWT